MERRASDFLGTMHEKLEELYSLEQKGWRVDSVIEKVWEEIFNYNEKVKEERLRELRLELAQIQKDLNGEGKRMPSTNPR